MDNVLCDATIFAPTDEAFSSIPGNEDGEIEDWLNVNEPAMNLLVNHHIVPNGARSVAQLLEEQEVVSGNDDQLYINKRHGSACVMGLRGYQYYDTYEPNAVWNNANAGFIVAQNYWHQDS